MAGRYRERRVIDARAPYADPRLNRPMTDTGGYATQRGGGLTSQGLWDNMFKNSLTGTNPLAASRPAGIVQKVLQDIGGTQFGDYMENGQRVNQSGTPRPTLETMAEGGMNHAQQWTAGANAGMQRVAGYADLTKPMRTSYGVTNEGQSSVRKPYIAGANGDVTKDYIAGGRYSSWDKDKTLDQSYTRRLAWGSGL